MKRISTHLWLAAGAFAVALSTPALAGVRVYVRVPPPPLIVETRPVAPSPRHVWIDGYHTWNGTAYVWSPGRWDLAPRGHARWVAGHWKHVRHGWYWVPGHWR